MKICPKCGQRYDDARRWCATDGTVLEVESGSEAINKARPRAGSSSAKESSELPSRAAIAERADSENFINRAARRKRSLVMNNVHEAPITNTSYARRETRTSQIPTAQQAMPESWASALETARGLINSHRFVIPALIGALFLSIIVIYAFVQNGNNRSASVQSPPVAQKSAPLPTATPQLQTSTASQTASAEQTTGATQQSSGALAVDPQARPVRPAPSVTGRDEQNIPPNAVVQPQRSANINAGHQDTKAASSSVQP